MDGKLIPFISETEIAATVQRLVQELDRDYENSLPILVGILKGSFIFLADLVRRMKTPIASIEFMRLSSYGASTVSAGKAEIAMGLPAGIGRDRHIVLIEDIVDTGITTVTASDYLRQRQPASLTLCALLDKPARRQVTVTIESGSDKYMDRIIYT